MRMKFENLALTKIEGRYAWISKTSEIGEANNINFKGKIWEYISKENTIFSEQ